MIIVDFDINMTEIQYSPQAGATMLSFEDMTAEWRMAATMQCFDCDVIEWLSKYALRMPVVQTHSHTCVFRPVLICLPTVSVVVQRKPTRGIIRNVCSSGQYQHSSSDHGIGTVLMLSK